MAINRNVPLVSDTLGTNNGCRPIPDYANNWVGGRWRMDGWVSE